MQVLLDDLRELSRISRLSNKPERVPLVKIVLDALGLVKGMIEENKVKVHVAADLPVVRVDTVRIRKLYENLVSNAIKFMGDQSDPIVYIGSECQRGEQVLYVRDNGIGIDPGYHKIIFRLFDKLNQHTKGTGIGLYVVKRIVEVHGGRIWVESGGAGKGATFFFTLPDTNEAEQREELNEGERIKHSISGEQSGPCGTDQAEFPDTPAGQQDLSSY